MDIKLDPKQKELVAHLIKIELAKRDPWVFITEYCQTDFLKENADGSYSEHYCTIPPYPYLKKLIKVLDTERKVAVPKSRRMLITWIVLCYCLWYCLTHKNAAIYLQKIKRDDAGFSDPNESLCSRIMKVYNRLPNELKQSQDLGITKDPPVINFKDTASIIAGVAEGPHQIRGKTPSIIVIDEMAFLDENMETMSTILPAVTTGAKVFCVSTPNGQEYFYKLVHGLEEEKE